MLREEAKWLSDALYSVEPVAAFPLLNLGSSSHQFRTQEQPWIDKLLFQPATQQGLQVIHTDMKQQPGVDMVGDLSQPLFIKALKAKQVKSVLCSNLLEHVLNREALCKNISDIVPVGGYLFVSVPYHYPYHRDPLDTLFRPSISELSALFPNFERVDAAIVPAGKLINTTCYPPILYLAIMLLRLLFPLYQPTRWLDSLRYSLWLFKEVSATCVVLRRTV